MPLPGLGRHISREMNKARDTRAEPTVVLDVNATNYLSGTLTSEDTIVIKAAFAEYIRREFNTNERAAERALASDVLKASDAYHVTLLYPSDRNKVLLQRAAEVAGLDLPSDYADLSKKKRAQLHGEVMRALKNKEPRVEMTFGDNAFVTADGELAAIEVRFLSASWYERIDPEKVFHVTLIYNRDVEHRAPAYANAFLNTNK